MGGLGWPMLPAFPGNLIHCEYNQSGFREGLSFPSKTHSYFWQLLKDRQGKDTQSFIKSLISALLYKLS